MTTPPAEPGPPQGPYGQQLPRYEAPPAESPYGSAVAPPKGKRPVRTWDVVLTIVLLVLDVVLTATHMKKGRVGTRVELLAHGTDVARLEGLLFTHTSTLGVRRMSVERRALPRGEETVHILGHDVRMKLARLPNGERRAKPEFEDVRAVSRATGRSAADVAALALAALERGGT